MVCAVVRASGLSLHTYNYVCMQSTVWDRAPANVAFVQLQAAEAPLCREQACVVECMEQWRAGFESWHLHMGGAGSILHETASAESEGGTLTKIGVVKTCSV